MDLKKTFLRGTLLLTFAGLTSRIMGFFYRIFLANTIGAEEMGIYQLIFPIYSVCFSLCASGIETAISKLTAEKQALNKPQEAFGILKTGIFLSLLLSIGCSIFIYDHARFLAEHFLKDLRCEELLKLLALTIPFGTVQSCICGYYFGSHKAAVPSAAQLIEQTCRIGCVFFVYHICTINHLTVSSSIAVIGLIFGELCALLFTITCFSFRIPKKKTYPAAHYFHFTHEIFSLAVPLTTSRLCINLLASLEAALIPNALKAYGMDSASALSVYGVLNGMALPFILFPNALTSSLSIMLLPTVSESQVNGQLNSIKRIVQKIFSFCLLMGTSCLFFFLLFGNFLGKFIFSNELAGTFLTILAWICPFLYLNTTLNSILNGLGLTHITFSSGIISLFIRIGFICFSMPKLGIYGYFISLLISQLFVTTFGCFFLNRTFSKS